VDADTADGYTDEQSRCVASLRSLAGENIVVTNLTGHPCVVVPNGFIDTKTPTSIVFFGHLYEEGKLIAIAKKYQDATNFHTLHPPLFK
jgi:Asp-tRNA(Asn)/Glu-tRNA(Gln) amidotransferase A subunit family amidase